MSITNRLDFFLLVLRPVKVFSGQVNGAAVDPYISITWDGGSTGTASAVGTSGAPVAGNSVWFGSTDGGSERGIVRLRDWTSSDATGTAGTMTIAETDDVGPNIADGDYISIYLEWRLWGKVPRVDATIPHNVIFYEDYNVVFSDQTINWIPMAVAGPPAVSFLSAGSATADFVGDRSYALAPGATLTTFLWTAYGSSEGTSSSQGTEASPVTFTWTSAGQYLVSLKVTDSNGNSHTTYTWVFVVDPASPTDVAYTQFDTISDSFDFNQGGGNCAFTVHGVADVSQFPQESLVLHVARGSVTTATGTWPNRSNILFCGYIQQGTIRQDPVHNTTSFQAVTIDGLMKSLSIYPVRMEDTLGANNWTQGENLTVDRLIAFLAHYRSTLSLMTPLRPINYTALVKAQDFAHTSLYTQMKNLLADAWGVVVSDHQSVLHFERDYQLMTTAERALVTTRKTLNAGIWVNTVDIVERPVWSRPVRKVKMNGVYYPGGGTTAEPFFTEAPGDVQSDFGNEDNKSGFILTTQSDLNTRSGLKYARYIQRYTAVKATFVNDGSFAIAPQEIFPAVIESTNNNRGLSLTPSLLPRRIRRTYSHRAGVFQTDVDFEPSASGPAGVTVTMPVEPPSKTGDGKRPPNDPPPEPPAWPPPVVPVPGAAVAADTIDGVWWEAAD